MEIKVHRGTHQVGGTITEIRTAKARIIIDLGEELPGVEKKENAEMLIEGVTVGKPDCDAVLATHYHGDHTGMLEKVLPGVPIYMGAIAKQILSTVKWTVKKKLDKGNPEHIEAFKTFTVGEKLTFGDITVTPLGVDHSAFDAYALLIEAEGKRVLHTGDFRMHGAKGRKMPLMFEKYANNIDVMITEGTLLSRPDERVMTEHEMSREATEMMRKNKNVFVLCSSTNIDSIAAFFAAAIETKKPFIVCDFQKGILDIVTKNSRTPFYNFDRHKIYNYGRNLHDMMQKIGFCMMVRVNRKSELAIKAFPDNLLIYSVWSGYLEKHRAAYDERTDKFVTEAKTAGSIFETLHTSGHATAEDIKRVCEITKAKIIIPIHSEQPEAFERLGIKGEVKVLNDGESYTF